MPGLVPVVAARAGVAVAAPTAVAAAAAPDMIRKLRRLDPCLAGRSDLSFDKAGILASVREGMSTSGSGES
ncbi:hypothetical protein GCM10010121_026140 [Streptomyces brasiliensis]|uniref:Uncharacterized protein n=1 Tax=Streptomyces brasiliensis TaxID=1954 RepID=A0A917KHS1_9ACTN|nr:hypothetical protein GCM10010121_026140 [Streptomyces brasiliensis]